MIARVESLPPDVPVPLTEGGALLHWREKLEGGATVVESAEDGWPDAVATCLAGAGADEPQRQCLLRLHAHQYRRWFLQLANGQPPAAAGEDDQRGPSCLQVADRYAQVIGVPGGSASVTRVPSRHAKARDLIQLGAYQPGHDAELDLAVRLQPKMNALLQQDMHERAGLDASRAMLRHLMDT